MNVLLTSVGRRVKLVDFFAQALQKNGGQVFAADAANTAPGLYRARQGFIVPGVDDKAYADRIMEICIKHNIRLVVPFIDPELPVLAAARQAFAQRGITVLVSSPQVVAIAGDKLKTAGFFHSCGVSAPHTMPGEEIEGAAAEINFPAVVKPRFGSAGAGVHVCRDDEELLFYLARVPHPIVQGYAPGDEVTMDILCDLEGNCLSIVPRKRLKVRGGEVERAVTVYDEELLALGARVAGALKPVGPINVQCFVSPDGVLFTEINPRFGGGYPLSHTAGAGFPEKIVRLARGERVSPAIGRYERGLVMMRYDEAVFCRDGGLIAG